MDCAHHRGYQQGSINGLTTNEPLRPLPELERILLTGLPLNRNDFYIYTGHAAHPTPREVECAVRWWAKGFHKGWAESLTQRQLQTTGVA